MVRRLRSAAGTVEQAATPVISTASPASRPRNINPSSSAVDRASVLIRQLWTSLSPSNVASTVLVFPMSMQSSTDLSSSTARRTYLYWIGSPVTPLPLSEDVSADPSSHR